MAERIAKSDKKSFVIFGFFFYEYFFFVIFGFYFIFLWILLMHLKPEHTSYPSKYALDKKVFEWKRISDLNVKYVLQKIKLLVFFGLM
jgi:hypothetical protein